MADRTQLEITSDDDKSKRYLRCLEGTIMVVKMGMVIIQM